MMIQLKNAFARLRKDSKGFGMLELLIICAILGGLVWGASTILGDHLKDKADESGEAVPTLQEGGGAAE